MQMKANSANSVTLLETRKSKEKDYKKNHFKVAENSV